MDAQHGPKQKRRPAGAAFRVLWCDEFDQCSPQHYLLHLLQELTLVGLLQAQIKVQGSLFYRLYFLRLRLRQAHKRGSYAKFPYQDRMTMLVNFLPVPAMHSWNMLLFSITL